MDLSEVDSRSDSTVVQGLEAALASSSAKLRVCDKCISRKVKCDQKRPVCSRCHEGGYSCIYSSAKKKPGPARGTHKTGRRSARPVGKPAQPPDGFDLDSVERGSGSFSIADIYIDPFGTEPPVAAGTILSDSGLATASIGLASELAPITPPVGTSRYLELGVSSEIQEKLLEDFFNFIHHSIPLFRKDRFVEQYRNGTINHNVLVTVLVVTAKVLGPAEIAQMPEIESCLRVLLKVDPFEGISQPNLMLDAFRQNCLLAYYRFHQSHGEDAWEYIGQLARKALRFGLHQLDFSDGYDSFGDVRACLFDPEEWRYVWWCIYCLDSYSNITAATPFVLEMDGIRTALVSKSLEDQGQNPPGLRAMKFLPTNTKDLWRISAEMGILNTPASYFNMHIVTTTILRQAATIRRLRRQNPCETLQERHRQFEDHLSAVLLSLPPAFLSETRNVLANEPSVSHHARLVCLLHLYSARLLNVTTLHDSNDTAWSSSWQRSLVCVEDIVAVIRHWDSRQCSTVDPAICLTVFCVLVLLHLHEIHEATATQFALRDRLEAERNLLTLFLQQFSQSWALPRLLREAFDNFTNMVKGPLTSHEISLLFTQVPGPFQPWRGLFGLAPSPPDPLHGPYSQEIEIAGLRFSSDFFSFL